MGRAAVPAGEFVGWGSLPYFSQYCASGKLTFNAELLAGANTYRAYRLPWKPATNGS
jgi:hypothetical protein